MEINKLIYGIIFLSLIFILPIVSATTIIPYSTISNTVITSTGLNISLNCTSTLYFGAIVNTNSIYIENINNNNNILESISYNITNERNKTYFCSDLPIIASNTAPSTGTQTVIISNNLTNLINVTGSFDSNNVFGGTNAKTLTINGNNNLFTSNNDSIFFTGQLTNGNNNLNINYFQVDNTRNGFCSVVTAGYSNFFSGIIILFGILAIGIIIVILYSIVKVTQGEELNFDFIDNAFENFPVKIVMISLLGITILIWIIISVMGALCGL